MWALALGHDLGIKSEPFIYIRGKRNKWFRFFQKNPSTNYSVFIEYK